MRHGISGRKFNRTSAHRKALLMNLAKALIKTGRIKTTLPKAKDLRPYIEKLVTKCKVETLHIRRLALSKLNETGIVSSLFDISKRMIDRNGGYTRIIKDGFRYGDQAPMAIIEFVDHVPSSPVESVEEQ